MGQEKLPLVNQPRLIALHTLFDAGSFYLELVRICLALGRQRRRCLCHSARTTGTFHYAANVNSTAIDPFSAMAVRKP